MKQLILIYLIAFSVFQSNCTQKQPDLEFEKSVAYQIFPLIMERIHFDRRLGAPRPPDSVYNKEGEIIGYDTIMAAEILEQWKKKADSLKKDPVKLIVAIDDSTEVLNYADLEYFMKRNVDNRLEFDKKDLSEKYKIEIDRLVAGPKLVFKYRSEFPRRSTIWEQDYNFHLSGMIGFSRILFDQSKQYGVLSTGFGCGKLCGTEYLVLIKKVGGKWHIDKMVVTSSA